MDAKTDAERDAGAVKGPSKPARVFGVRHLQIGLMFLALVCAYAMRVNMSVAIVSMTDRNGSNPDFEEYDWSPETQSTILSSFFWGYVVTQIPGGQLAQRYGPKMFLLGAIGVCGLFNIFTPLAASCGGWGLVCACRVVQGLAQGTTFPCIHTLLSKWAPVEERGNLATYVYAGTQFGTIVALPISGLLAKSSIGWPGVFYVFGGISLMWAVLWSFLGADSPETHGFIPPDEKLYIQASLERISSANKGFKTPWRYIMTSVPMISLILAHCGQNWGFWTLLTEMPSYMNHVLKYDIKKNTLLSSLPYLAMWLMSFVFCWASGYLEERKMITLTTSRKIFNSIAQGIPGIALVGLGYVQKGNGALAVALLTIAMGVNSGTYVGFQVNHIDLSPNYAGTMMGITNCAANIMSILGPLFVGLVVKDQENIAEWRTAFFVAAAVYFLSTLNFVLFGSAEVQPWNDPEYKKTKNQMELKQREEKNLDNHAFEGSPTSGGDSDAR
ncbi:putative inorganic phosphate cotransporter isoform X2 [Bacillus rossius redtenbacheri]|uniref:putative inorganic phosphate cotransporter isoform X2 n=1 Tax=Bacillus rossius redtenbacheri TaxID=93214 RepID=UPI002FDD91C1